MKNYTTLILALFSCFAFAQVEVGAKRYGRQSPIKSEVLQKLKKSTTLFVLPDWIDTQSYEQILKEVWTVTPYEIMAFEDYEIQDLYESNYTFVTIDFHKEQRKNTTGNSVTALYAYLDFSLYNGTEITKRIARFDARVRDKKMPIILNANRTSLAKCYLYPKDEFVQIAAKGKRLGILESLYAQNVYYNYSEGMLKNYLQKVNNQILKGSTYALELKDHHATKLSELANSTLYIPEYAILKTNIIKRKVSQRKDKEIKNLLQSYEYDYQTISDEALSEAIIDKKDIHYLRYVRIDDENFIQVVSALTGEIIFRDYVQGVSYNLKPKNFEYLSQVISQTVGKLAK